MALRFPFAPALAFWLALPAALCSAETKANSNFNRSIRPILSEHCFACHGPDSKARKAGLRLDLREEALKPAKSGAIAIVPGDTARSELVARITSTDEDELMPPPKAHKKLSPSQIDVLRQWIADGATYQKHWAFEPLEKPGLEKIPPSNACANPIDTLVAARLQERKLHLAPEASPETLLRRVTLDLTGLPPTLEEMDAFRAALQAPDAQLDACYGQLVDRLLASRHFGEHLAVSWLDAARYADTNGYFGDKPRQMWLWRDWVIDAFNFNMPFDRFTIEQLAGDLLPDATLSQRIATGFNRNHMANNESGIIDEEFRTEYVFDRIDTTMTTWLGLTAGCAQCHDHKFDPISQREFYQLFALFNNVPESGLIKKENPPPSIEVPSSGQQRRLKELSATTQLATKIFSPMRQAIAPQIAAWEKEAPSSLPLPPRKDVVWHESFDGQLAPGAKSIGTTFEFEDGVLGPSAKFDATRHIESDMGGLNLDEPWSIGFWVSAEGPLSCPLSIIESTGNRRGVELIWQKGRLQINLVHRWGVSAIEAVTSEPMSAKYWHHIVLTYDGSRKASGLRVFVDGASAAFEPHRDTLDGTLANSEPLRVGRRDSGLGYYGQLDEVRLVQQCADESMVSDWFWGERLRGIVATDPKKRGAREKELLLDFYVNRFASPEIRAAHQKLKQATEIEGEIRATIPTVLVMEEMTQPRATHVLERGQYNKPGEGVQPNVPSAIAPWPDSAPRNRLGFARWLVSLENPLTARVAVNRLWHQCFGEGLVRTMNDFGSQGEPPTHPELLDWLAVIFRESGWDVKSLLKQIVTSRTYRQSSSLPKSPSQLSDPENRLLARGSNFRLSAEMLRDQALSVSGLLVPTMGGLSARPYQPSGLWEAVSYNGEESYAIDAGEGMWRRSLYTYVKRQAPPPILLTFDGPTREKCVVRRARTNTPLQALMLLNDDTFVEAARALASQIINFHGDDPAKLSRLWRGVLCRNADESELVTLGGLLLRQRERFSDNAEAAKRLLNVGASSHDASLDAHELAAWTVVAQTVLNLDETITRR